MSALQEFTSLELILLSIFEVRVCVKVRPELGAYDFLQRNRIQRSRKDLDFNVEDRITIRVQANEELKRVMMDFSDYIKNETLAQDLEFVSDRTEKMIEFEVESHSLNMELNQTK